MFDFSLGKLLLLALIALVVLGPEKLPGAARTVGALIRRVRSGWDSVRAEVERELEIEEIRSAARKAAADAEAAQAQANETLHRLQDEVHKARAESLEGLQESSRDATETTPDDAMPTSDVNAAGADHGKG